MRQVSPRDMRGRAVAVARSASDEGRYSLIATGVLVLVVREIDEGEAARGEQAQDAVVLELDAFGQRLVGLRWHLPYDIAPLSHPRALSSHLHMIHSMTGYAAARAESPRGRLASSCARSTHRYLDMQFRIAEELRALEPLLREAIAARVTRGKVDCRLTLSRRPRAPAPRARTRRRCARLRALARGGAQAFPDAAPLRVADVLHWPGVLAAEPLPTRSSCAPSPATLCRRALDELVAARAREGAKLAGEHRSSASPAMRAQRGRGRAAGARRPSRPSRRSSPSD